MRRALVAVYVYSTTIEYVHKLALARCEVMQVQFGRVRMDGAKRSKGEPILIEMTDLIEEAR